MKGKPDWPPRWPFPVPRVWASLPGLILRDERGPGTKARRLAIYCALTLGGLVGRLALAFDALVQPNRKKAEIREPVFIVGNARSGTTLLHRLLCGDQERFATFRLWELFMPSLCQKRFVRGAMNLFGRMAPDTLEKLVAWEARQLPEFKKMNPVGINKTQEDELLLIPFFATPTIAVTFPYMRELEEMEYFDELPEVDREPVLALYRECVERQLAFCGGNRTFLSKNPTFVGKLRSILHEFPDARIIYPVRDPLDSLPSLLTMMRHIWEGMGFDDDEVRRASQSVADGTVKDYRYAPEVLAELAPERFAVIEFDEFIANPADSVRNLYRHFGWKLSSEYSQWLDAESQSRETASTRDPGSLAEFGIDREKIVAQLGIDPALPPRPARASD